MITPFLEHHSHKPLYEQLYQYIKQAIESAELVADEKLPSKRQLAQHLKISVVTVETAYNQLVAEGYIKAKPKSGFYVLPFVKLDVKSHHRFVPLLRQAQEELFLYDFLTNAVDCQHFPYDTWAKIEREVWLDQYPKQINHTDYLGVLELRQQIAALLFEYRGIETSPHNIVIGSGSEHLISLLILLLGRENHYGVEEPGYLKNHQLYQDYGAVSSTVALDQHGIDLQAIKDCNVLHITPSHQFPTGIVMPIARRMELLNWALKESNRYIIEDDYDSEFRFSGNPIPALKGLDTTGRVIYMNSFSKSIAPSLRISFMVLPDQLMRLYQDSYAYFTCSVPMVTQMVLSTFIQSKAYERHLNRMKNLYKSKRDFLIEQLKSSSFGAFIDIIGEEAGLHFLIKIKHDTAIKKLIKEAKKVSVRVYGIHEYRLNKRASKDDQLIVVGYAHMSDDDFVQAVKRLEKAWTFRE